MKKLISGWQLRGPAPGPAAVRDQLQLGVHRLQDVYEVQGDQLKFTTFITYTSKHLWKKT